MKFEDFKKGQRVRFLVATDLFPAGTIGTVSEFENWAVWVLVNTHRTRSGQALLQWDSGKWDQLELI